MAKKKKEAPAAEETVNIVEEISKTQVVESIDPNLLFKKMMSKNSMPGKSINSRKIPNQGK